MLRAAGHLDGASVTAVETAAARHRPDVRQRPGPAHLRRPDRRPGGARGQAAGGRRDEPRHRGRHAQLREGGAVLRAARHRPADPDARACSTSRSTPTTSRGSCSCSRTSRPRPRATSSSAARRTTAASAVRELVGLHAPRWGDPTLADLEWLAGDRATGHRDAHRCCCRPCGRGSASGTPPTSTTTVHEAGDALFAHLADYLTPTGGPETVVHGDYRLDNLLFHADGTASPASSTGRPAPSAPRSSDVAYFIGAGLRAEEPARARGGARAGLPRRPRGRRGLRLRRGTSAGPTTGGAPSPAC